MQINLTENSYIFQSAIRLANEQLKKAIDLLYQHEKAWNGQHNLKLYDIGYGFDCSFECNGAMVNFNDNARTSWFKDFCEISYSDFLEYLDNIGEDRRTYLDYIGSTSSFYIDKLHALYISDTLAEASNEYMYSLFEVETYKIDNKEYLKIDVEKSIDNYEDIEDFVNGLMALSEVVYDEVKDKLENIIKVHNYIEDFKENQVSNFMEYVEENWKCNI